MPEYVAYYRVSTQRQGQSGLGLEAQREAVQPYAADIVAEYTEVESGKRAQRPQLQAALDHCKRIGATILIAKLDRLSRDAGFLFALRDSGVAIKAADMPHASTLEFGIRAVFAQHEREQISERTKAALRAAKARGVKLGSPTPSAGGQATRSRESAALAASYAQAVPLAQELQRAGLSLREVAAVLNRRAIPTARGGAWHASSVRNALASSHRTGAASALA